MTVLFHGNFALNRTRMAGILSASLSKPSLNDKQLAEPFGYQAPFGRLYRSWLHKTGVAKMGLPIELTQFGKVVFDRDPKLESSVSQWFMHHELVTDPERAEAWHFFACEFLPNHSKFSKEDLIDGLTMKLRPHSEMHFGPGSKLNKQIARKIIQVYTEDSGLGQLGLISYTKGLYHRLDTQPLGPWKSESALQNAY